MSAFRGNADMDLPLLTNLDVLVQARGVHQVRDAVRRRMAEPSSREGLSLRIHAASRGREAMMATVAVSWRSL
jgi:hypothetical protein